MAFSKKEIYLFEAVFSQCDQVEVKRWTSSVAIHFYRSW